MFRGFVVAALLLAASANAAVAGDAVAGKKLFKLQCATCHSAAEGKNAVGPSLFNVVGRKAGTVPGFVYSETNRNSGLVWDEATLDTYVSKPKSVVGRNKMTFAGVKNATDRANVIAYLETLH